MRGPRGDIGCPLIYSRDHLIDKGCPPVVLGGPPAENRSPPADAENPLINNEAL